MKWWDTRGGELRWKSRYTLRGHLKVWLTNYFLTGHRIQESIPSANKYAVLANSCRLKGGGGGCLSTKLAYN